MKYLLIALILVSGCKSTSYFNTSNDVARQKSILYLRNKDTIAGEISVIMETSLHANVTYPSAIEFTPEGKSIKQNIPLDDVVGYRIGTVFYALKKVDIHMNGINRLLFLKQLTPDHSKIQLYELFESGNGNDTGEREYSYYLSLQGLGPIETINTRSSKIMPLFEEKMSKIVADCPALAEKIRLKEKGYFIPFVTFSIKKHPEVLLRIINEYNNCR